MAGPLPLRYYLVILLMLHIIVPCLSFKLSNFVSAFAGAKRDPPRRRRPILIRPSRRTRRRDLPRHTHIFTLPRQCRRTSCILRAKAQLEQHGCTHTVELKGLQMLRAYCGRGSNVRALEGSLRFAAIQVDHSISLAALPHLYNNSITLRSVARKLRPMPPAPDSHPQPTPIATDSFEKIEVRDRAWDAHNPPRQFLPASFLRAASPCYPSRGAGTRVFVIDTGCRSTHEQLRGRVSTYAAPGSPYPSGDDDHGHGTHVAATIAGRDFGIAPSSHVTCIKALSGANAGSSTDVIAAIEHVIALKSSSRAPFLLSISLGVAAPPSYSALDRAVSRAAAWGITAVVAGGNAAGDACGFTPARAPGAITVAALAGRGLASFSNVGACVDVAAPGVAVRSAFHRADTAYASSSGTSMAAPYVSGVAALILGERPQLRPQEVLTEMRMAAVREVRGIPVLGLRRGECRREGMWERIVGWTRLG